MFVFTYQTEDAVCQEDYYGDRAPEEYASDLESRGAWDVDWEER